MAADILLGADGDIDLTNDTMTIATTVEQTTKQQVIITLNCYRGEWIFNIDFGVPYLKNDNNPEQLLGVGDKSLIDTAIQAALIDIDNITEIVSYVSTQDKQARTLSVSFDVKTNTGEIVSILDLPIG